MFNTFADIKNFQKTLKQGNSLYKALSLSVYLSKNSVLHKQRSPLVKFIDKKLLQLKTQNVWQALYHLLNDLPNTITCKMCDETIHFTSRGYQPYCSRQCSGKSPEVRQNLVNTMTAKYGVATSFDLNNSRELGIKNARSKQANEKRKTTNLKKFGTEHAVSNKQVRNKINATLLKNYGSMENRMSHIIEKGKQTIQDRYGVDHYSKHPDYRKRFIETSLDTYGTFHPMQSKVIQKRLRKSMQDKYGKEYPMQVQKSFDKQQMSSMERKRIRIKGCVFKNLQGFEPQAIKWLVKQGAPLLKIKTHPVISPTIEWRDKKNKLHVYFPDLLINKHLIEVKSAYTFIGNPKMLEMNKRKCQACVDRGYKFSILVFNQKGELLKKLTRIP